MIEFKTVSIREKTYDYVDSYACLHQISKAQALDDMINHFKSCERKKEISKLAERQGDGREVNN